MPKGMVFCNILQNYLTHMHSSRTPPCERALERELVRMLEPAAGGQAMGDAGHADFQRREDFREVVRRRLAFDIGTEGENDFRGILFAYPFKKGLDSQLGRADVVER